jgi:anhydro-N-acetylmuramic acid kinase
LVTGGGAYHDFLIEQIKNYSQEAKIVIPNADLVEYKEALIFGLLGVLRFRNEINVLSSVTGASSDHSSGVIFYPAD